MIEATIAEIAEIVGGTVVPPTGSDAVSVGGTLVRGVGIDTRADLASRLFIAIRGERHDGHDHLQAAREAGAAAAMVARDRLRDLGNEAISNVGIPLLAVDDTVAAMTELARWHRAGLRGTVVGVTGSAGKTTTRALLEAVLAPLGRGTASIKSFNNHIGVPLTLLDASIDDRWIVLEMGTSGPGEIPHLVSIARPEIAVITGTGRSHLEALGDEAGVAREKATILDGARVGIVNVDRDAILIELDRRRDTATEIVTYGVHERADRRLLARIPGLQGGQRLELDDFTANLALDGPHNAINAVAAIEVARRLGVSDRDIAAALAAAVPPSMRFSRRRIGDFDVFDDVYNANPESMRASLAAFDELAGERRRVVVLGDMLELGPGAAAMHREIGGCAAAVRPTHLVLVGRFGAATGEGARAAGATAVIHEAADAATAADAVAAIVEAGDAVFVKASRGVGLERVIRTLVERSEATA
jgi:UDP-N-acetylmuramoyl-tripeptide--D-alanyl-D-alanine ligase